MKYMFKTLVLLFLILPGARAQTPDKPPVQTVPDFEFLRFNNTVFTNKDLPGGKMLFFLFFDSDCEHCQRSIKNIGQNYQSFKKASIYLISMDDVNKINHYMDTYGRQLKGQKNVTILQDKFHQFIEKFRPLRYPSMFLFSPEKKLIDYEDNDESVFRLVNALNKNAK